MSTQYFKNFEKIYYRFGDETSFSLFQNLSQYVDILDQVKSQKAFYEDYTIKSGDRPDTLALLMYGDPKYYWTFYLMNDHLRESGWPLMNEELLDRAKGFYPHRVLSTEGQIADPDDDFNFAVGQQIIGQLTGTVGTIIKRNLDLGQLVVDTTTSFISRTEDFDLDVNTNGAADLEIEEDDVEKWAQTDLWIIHKYPAGTRENGVIIEGHDFELDKIDTLVRIRSIAFEIGYDYVLTATIRRFNGSDSVFRKDEQVYFINPDKGTPVFLRLYNEQPQYNAVHHYENADGEWVDVDPYSQDRSNLNAITYYERMVAKNEDLKQIKILKPNAVEGVSKEFYKLMQQR